MRCDVSALRQQGRLQADTVIMNPPFGTRRKGADLDFLRAAFHVCFICLTALDNTILSLRACAASTSDLLVHMVTAQAEQAKQ